MAEVIRNSNSSDVLAEIFFGVRCDCGSEDCEPCEPDGSPLLLGLLSFVRCSACGSIYEIIYPDDRENGELCVRFVGKHEK
jgi:hypothetical protein